LLKLGFLCDTGLKGVARQGVQLACIALNAEAFAPKISLCVYLTEDNFLPLMKIALAQLNPTIGDLTGNAEQILAAAEQAAGQGVRLLTPELSLCGYPPRDLLLDPRFIEAMATTFNSWQKICRQSWLW